MKRRFVARCPARVRITTSVTSQSFLWRRDATQLISFKTVCYDANFTFIHNSIFKNTYRCRFIHRDLSFLTLFLFTFSICDGHSNISKRCDLCLTEKLMIITANPDRILNKRSELISKCRHENKFYLRNN